MCLPPEAGCGGDAGDGKTVAAGDTELYADVARWMNRWLGERFQVYAHRDAAYWRIWLWSWPAMTACWNSCFWDEGLGCVRFGAGPSGNSACSTARTAASTGEYPCSGPGIMARVVNAPAFLSGFGVNGDCPCQEMEVPLVIRDPQIEENNGLFCWRLKCKRFHAQVPRGVRRRGAGWGRTSRLLRGAGADARPACGLALGIPDSGGAGAGQWNSPTGVDLCAPKGVFLDEVV